MPRTIWGKEKVTWMTQARFSMKTLCVFPLWFWALSGWGLLFVDAGSKKWTRRKKSECEKIKKMRWKNKTRCYKQKRIFCVWFFWRLRVGINVLLGKKERCGVEKNLVRELQYYIYRCHAWEKICVVKSIHISVSKTLSNLQSKSMEAIRTCVAWVLDLNVIFVKLRICLSFCIRKRHIIAQFVIKRLRHSFFLLNFGMEIAVIDFNQWCAWCVVQFSGGRLDRNHRECLGWRLRMSFVCCVSLTSVLVSNRPR